MTTTVNNSQPYIANLIVSGYSNMYVGIGKSSAWPNDSQPPAEDETKTNIDEPLFFKKVMSATLCRPLKSGETAPSNAFTLGTDTYIPFSSNSMYSEFTPYVYIVTSFSYTDIGSVSFRETGLFAGLTVNSGVSKTVLTPADVANVGGMISYSNHSPVTLNSSGKYTAGILLYVKMPN